MACGESKVGLPMDEFVSTSSSQPALKPILSTTHITVRTSAPLPSATMLRRSGKDKYSSGGKQQVHPTWRSPLPRVRCINALLV
jgi:hypothetical protein